MTSNPIIVGLLAGIASGLLLLAANSAGIFSALLFLATPLPIYITVLAWGTIGGVAASVAAIAIVGAFTSVDGGLVVGALMTIPALAIGHQANLAQPSEEDNSSLIWFPLSQLLFNLASIVAAGFILAGWFLGFSIEPFVPVFVDLLKQIGANNPNIANAPPETLEAMARGHLSLIPFILPAFWLVVHIINMHLAVKIARASGKMPRPADNLPNDADLPQIALLGLPVVMVLTMIAPAPLSHVFSAFAGAFFMAFALVGLAALHKKAQSNPGARTLLFISYVLIVLFTLPLIAFAIAGIYRVFSGTNNSPSQSNSST